MAATTKLIAKPRERWVCRNCGAESNGERGSGVCPKASGNSFGLGHWFELPVPSDEPAHASLSRALDLLTQLLALVPAESFQWPAAQDTMREAAALLVETGRVAPRVNEAIEMWLGAEGRK